MITEEERIIIEKIVNRLLKNIEDDIKKYGNPYDYNII